MGLAYVAPIGLQNLFVINSALTHTRKRALLTALIVILFDVTLALASCLWFTGLTLLISLFSDNFTPKTLVVINKVCGGVIIFYGAKLIWSFVQLMGWL